MRFFFWSIITIVLAACSSDMVEVKDKSVAYFSAPGELKNGDGILMMSCDDDWNTYFIAIADENISKAKVYLDDEQILSDPHVSGVIVYLEEEDSIFDANFPLMMADGKNLRIEFVVENKIESAEFDIRNIEKHFRHLKKNCRSVG